MCEIIMIPFRVAMPNSAMKPMIEATESTPPEANTPTAPPISASGRLSMMITASPSERNAAASSTRMPSTTVTPSQSRRREAAASLSNCPPYSIE